MMKEKLPHKKKKKKKKAKFIRACCQLPLIPRGYFWRWGGGGGAGGGGGGGGAPPGPRLHAGGQGGVGRSRREERHFKGAERRSVCVCV